MSREQLELNNVDLHQALAEALHRLGTPGNADLVDVLDRTSRDEEIG